MPAAVTLVWHAAASSDCDRLLRLPGAASTSKELAAGSIESQQDAASEAAERAAVDYITQHVLTSRPERHVVDNVMLSKLTAKNKTVEEYRSKVSQYLSSSGFKQRWDALKTQVSWGRGMWRVATCSRPAAGTCRGLLLAAICSPIQGVERDARLLAGCNFSYALGSAADG